MPEHLTYGRFKLRSVPGSNPPRFTGHLVMNALTYDLDGEIEVDGQGKCVAGSVSSTGPTLEEEIANAPPMPDWMRREPVERPRTLKVKR